MSSTSKLSGYPGLRTSRECLWPKRRGRLYLFDCNAGAPVGVGPDGERWAIIWTPTRSTRAKARFLHLPRFRDAERALRQLRTGEKDEYGMFDAPNEKPTPPKQLTESEDAEVVYLPPCPDKPVNPAQLIRKGALDAQAAATLTQTLVDRFSPTWIADQLQRLVAAKRPLYGNVNGEQAVIGYEEDFATQRAALQLLLAYQQGLPVKRSEEIVQHQSTDADVIARLAMKPHYRAAMLQYIHAVDAAQAGQSLDAIQRLRDRDREG